MKHIQKIKLSLIVSCCFIYSIVCSQRKVVDKIVAQLGNNIILLSDLQQQKIQAIQNKQEINSDTDCKLLEEDLVAKLILFGADIDSVTVSDEQVNAEMDFRIRDLESKMGGREALESFYGTSVAQIKEKFFSQIKKSLTTKNMQEQITSNLEVSPREIKSFFHKIPKDSIPYINSNVMVGQLVVYPQITIQDKELVRSKLNKFREQILKGEKDFSVIATIESKDPGSASQGGSLGWTSMGKMVPEFEAAALSLNPGEISPVFESVYGFHIVQLMDRKGRDYSARHILLTPEFNDKSVMKAFEKINEAKSLLDNGSEWKNVVEKFSEDQTTSKNSGIIFNPYNNDIKWDIQNINQIDRDMFLVVDELEEGEYSSPKFYIDQAKRQKGIRIIKLLERTKPHSASLDTDYKLIQEAAINEKKMKVIEEWINDNISKPYIRIEEEYQSCPFKYKWIKNKKK